MATYAVMGEIAFTDSLAQATTKRDMVLGKIRTFLANKPAWGDKVAVASTDYDKHPSITLEVRFTQYPDSTELRDLAKTELNKLTGVKATVTRHICYHDETPVKSCGIGETITIVR